MLLMLARPIATVLPDHPRAEDGAEVRWAAHDAPPGQEDEPATTPRPGFAAASLEAGAGADSSPPPPEAVVEHPSPASATPRGGLSAVLRAGGLACLSEREVLLSPTERELCREKLGDLAGKLTPLPSQIAPEERADYDAIARAQAPRRAMVPLTARGAGGLFNIDDRLRGGRGPRAGCSMKFGLNADQAPKGPDNALRAGSCFIRLPTGAPTGETSVRKSY